jgi:hypothetical protein
MTAAGMRFEQIFRQFTHSGHLSSNFRQSAPSLSSSLPPSAESQPQPGKLYGSLLTLKTCARKKSDILEAVQDLVVMHRKPVHLFSKFKARILGNLKAWTASELGVVCHAWAQLGFLKEDFCVAISDRVVESAPTCSADSLVNLLDAFASTRCVISSAVEAINREVTLKVAELDPRQLGLHCSSLARLNIRDIPLLTLLRMQILRASDASLPFSARDITLTAYSFSKLDATDPILLGRLAGLSGEVMRDFTAKDLQMMATSYEREADDYAELFAQISMQAQRRIAQFSGDTIVGLMRAFAKKGVTDSELATRVISQLPRISVSLKAKESVCLLDSLATMKMQSDIAVEVLGGVMKEKVHELGMSDWLSVLRSLHAMQATESPLLESFSVAFMRVLAKKTRLDQLVQLADVLAKLEYRNAEVLDIVTESLRNSLPELSPSNAADIYCSYASLRAYEQPKHSGFMQSVMMKALQQERASFN